MIHKPIGIKQAERIYDGLREIRQTATMKSMNLDSGTPGNPITKLVRKKTQLWRESWLVEPLDNIITQIREQCGFK
ncbi:hypothetical protein LCGC14_0377030 [marine sediment metagenome]|uniref:Uncharacterized protein n=1 Tax=marine sediment metagenome TaxID=412755 RepID=A0A0F9TLQ7_9ZZZZ